MQEECKKQISKTQRSKHSQNENVGFKIWFFNHRIRTDTAPVLQKLCKSKMLIKQTCYPNKCASDQNSFRYQRIENNTEIRL